jgi:diguanylate cyclase (GGDEF)-like protein/PAS domain S-box-containing protein
MKLRTLLAHSPIRVRLTVLIAANSSAALLLAGIGLFAYETWQQRSTETRELSSEAGIIADNSMAALNFSDDRAARETLSALRGDSRMIQAVIYDRDGKPFAQYLRDGAARKASIPARREGVYYENGALLLFRPISVGGERLGTIFLESASDLGARLRRFSGIVFFVLTISLGLALMLGARTQRTISEPISELSLVARRVISEKDYSARAPEGATGEIGILVDSFNKMLSHIQSSEEFLRESEERYALAARGANDGLWDWKLSTNKIYLSSRWREMLGYSGGERWTDPEEWFGRIHPADRERVKNEIARHIEGATSELVSEYRMRRETEGFVWMLTRGIAVRDALGAAIRMAGSQTDITEGKVADPLTDLPNRLYFLDKLEAAIEDYRRGGQLFAVLFLDLDRFKLINDSLGHTAGDELLLNVSGRLRTCIAEAERSTGARRSFVARLGGDEFAVLLGQIPDEATAGTVARIIVRELNSPFHIMERQVFATVSIGAAMGSAGATPEELLRNADTAMYHAKAKGKARYEIFDDTMRERAVARLEVETRLRKAIETNQLVLFYQPEISTVTRRVVGYEALVRWNHPERGIVGPGEFIPVAEESDLIVQLGSWVLKEACGQMALWNRSVTLDSPLTISVNVAPRQLADPRFVEEVVAVLRETSLSPACLKLEVTESSIMGNPEVVLDVLRRLKALGVGLEIDDFGTGYSSLSYLQKLPFDTVKVDRSFVKELGNSTESFEIVKTIVDLARSLQMRVVAEGVETRDQLESLSGLGCNYAQGFYFSKPIGAEATYASLCTQAEARQDIQRLAQALRSPQDGQKQITGQQQTAEKETEVSLVG